MVDTFIILIVVMVSSVYTYVKMYQIVHVKHVQIIVYQFDLKSGFEISVVEPNEIEKGIFYKTERTQQHNKYTHLSE